MTEADAVAAALQEAAQPTLAMTEQFFEVHTLASDPVALVEHTDDEWIVTLHLDGVQYYWRCWLELDGDTLTTRWSGDVEHAYAYLSLASDHLTPEDIGNRIGLPATRSRRMGHRIGGPKSNRKVQEHIYYFDAPALKAADLNRQFAALLDALAPHANAVAETVEVCGGGSVIVCYVGWSASMGGIWLEPQQADLLGRMGLALDVDLYAEGPDLL